MALVNISNKKYICLYFLLRNAAAHSLNARNQFVSNIGYLWQKAFLGNFYGKRKQFLSMEVRQHSNSQSSGNLLNDFLVKGKHEYASSTASHQARNNLGQVIGWIPSTVTTRRRDRALCQVVEMKVFVFGGSTFPHLTAFHHHTNDRNWQKPGSCATVLPAERKNSH